MYAHTGNRFAYKLLFFSNINKLNFYQVPGILIFAAFVLFVSEK